MWRRTELKTNAKIFLRTHYWKAFVVALIVFLTGGNEYGLFSGGSQSRPGGNGTGVNINIGDIFFGGSSGISGTWLERIGIPLVIFVSIGMAMTAFLLFLAFRVFVGAPLEVGGRKFFYDGIREEPDLSNLLSVFRSAHYLNVVKTMFLRGLYIFLWTLLLIIPGIIKHFAYRMVPFILSEEPDLDADEAIRRSIDMTHGHKMDMFVLDLSFIGWYILGSLLLGIGIVFVHPYYEATYAQLYNKLRQQPVSFSAGPIG
jgi:uncharacterized membrane protein